MNWRLYFQNPSLPIFWRGVGAEYLPGVHTKFPPPNRLAQKLFDIFDTLQFLFFFAHHAQGARSVWGGLG